MRYEVVMIVITVMRERWWLDQKQEYANGSAPTALTTRWQWNVFSMSNPRSHRFLYIYIAWIGFVLLTHAPRSLQNIITRGLVKRRRHCVSHTSVYHTLLLTTYTRLRYVHFLSPINCLFPQYATFFDEPCHNHPWFCLHRKLFIQM